MNCDLLDLVVIQIQQRTTNLKNLILRTGTRTPWMKRRNSNGWKTGTRRWTTTLPKIFGKNCKRAASDDAVMMLLVKHFIMEQSPSTKNLWCPSILASRLWASSPNWFVTRIPTTLPPTKCPNPLEFEVNRWLFYAHFWRGVDHWLSVASLTRMRRLVPCVLWLSTIMLLRAAVVGITCFRFATLDCSHASFLRQNYTIETSLSIEMALMTRSASSLMPVTSWWIFHKVCMKVVTVVLVRRDSPFDHRFVTVIRDTCKSTVMLWGILFWLELTIVVAMVNQGRLANTWSRHSVLALKSNDGTIAGCHPPRRQK